eukprot:gene11911-24951_t
MPVDLDITLHRKPHGDQNNNNHQRAHVRIYPLDKSVSGIYGPRYSSHRSLIESMSGSIHSNNNDSKRSGKSDS